MPDNALPAPVVDLAALIPVQRAAAPTTPVVPQATTRESVVEPERLAFLWTLLGAVAGAALVAVAFLALLTLLP